MRGRWMWTVVLVIAWVGAAAPAAPAAAGGHGRGRAFKEGEVLVRLGRPLSPGETVRRFAARGVDHAAKADRAGWSLVRGRRSTAELMRALRDDPAVAAVEPNYTAGHAATIDHGAGTWVPDDPWFPRQWNLAAMPGAWYLGRGEPSVVVAVLDTGYRASEESPLHVLPGFDFVNDDADPDDDSGHGTHIASVALQTADNGRRAAGIAPGAALLPIKVLDAEGAGTVATVAAGIYHAADHGADVINLSLALSPLVRWSDALHDAVAYAAASGAVLVASSGNHGVPLVALPAAFNEVIAVGAVHSGGGRARYSNWGTGLDLVAPGGDDQDRDDDGYADGIAAQSLDPATGDFGLYLGTGTSQAAAHVSGVAALLISRGIGNRDRVRAALALTATDVAPSGFDLRSGAGALAAAAAVTGGAELPAVAAPALPGWVVDQDTWATAPDLGEPVGLVVADPSGTLVVIEDAAGVHGIAADGPDTLALHLLDAALEGVLDGVAQAGSVTAYLEQVAVPKGTFEFEGGMAAFLGVTLAEGTVVTLRDVHGADEAIAGLGGVASIAASPSALAAAIAAEGGFFAFLAGSGGLGVVEQGGIGSDIGGQGGLGTDVGGQGGLGTDVGGQGGLGTDIGGQSLSPSLLRIDEPS